MPLTKSYSNPEYLLPVKLYNQTMINAKMITAERVNRSILVVLFSICLFLLLDCYVFPLDTSKGVIVTKTEQKISRLRVSIFRIETEKHTVTVPPIGYRNAG
jgi:hypothetical protein